MPLVTTAPDGSPVEALDEGRGRPIVILHPGLDDGSSWNRVARRLAASRRVLRLRRRQYRPELKRSGPATIGQEVDDVRALLRHLGEPALLVGHSSGGVVALEALAAAPDEFAGAVLYEPPVVTGPPLGGAALARARQALAEGRPATAAAEFLGDIAGYGPVMARLAGSVVAGWPVTRALLPHQLDDVEAIDRLGLRLPAYATIDCPTALLTGARSPAAILARSRVLADTLPRTAQVALPATGHAGHRTAPAAVSRIIEIVADRTLR